MKHRKKDYQRKIFRNPFFPKAKSKTKIGVWGIILLFIIFFFGLYLLNNLDCLKIKNISVKGNQYVGESEIQQVISEQINKQRFLLFSQNSIIFFSKLAAKKQLTKNYSFEQIKIKKHYFNTIEVLVKEKISRLILASGQDRYYLDINGKAIQKVMTTNLKIDSGQAGTEIIRPETGENNQPLIYDQSNKPVIIGQEAIAARIVDFIIELTAEINKSADFTAAYYTIANPAIAEINLVTKEGWQVYFDASKDAAGQMETLHSVLQQKVEKTDKLQYIDLRYGEKVFWK